MTALEPIIAILVGAGITLGATWLTRFLGKQSALKYGPILARAYDIIDPLLERNMRSWSGSDVEFAMELAIEAVADGKLTPQEIKEAAKEAAVRWLPQVAADKVRKYEQLVQQPKPLTASNILAGVVSGATSKEAALSEIKTLFK